MSTELQTGGELDATLDRIMALLSTETDEPPEEAILQARRHRDAIIPRLIRAIEEATVATAAGHPPDTWEAHTYALLLLAEFQAKQALPAIIASVSLPGEGPFDLFGDTITENLSSILAGLVDEPFDVLDELIRNRSLNEYVRWEAANTFLYLVRDGRLTREEAVARLRQHLREAIDNRDQEAGTFLVVCLVDFADAESLDDIRKAFEIELVDEMAIDLPYVEECLRLGDEEFSYRLESCPPTGIPDSLELVKSWNWRRDDELSVSSPFDLARVAAAGDSGYYDDDAELDENVDVRTPGTIRNVRQHIGRNDPCPCGSGKKFKKCCGGR